MKYQIDWSEKKTTTTGKAVMSATLKDETGATYDKVSIWSDFPDYANLMTGHSVEGEIITNDKGYKSLKPVFAPKQGGNGAYKQKVMDDAMEKKAGYITQAQGNKEMGIKVASTMRMAVDLAIADDSPTPLAEKILFWRKWTWEHWDAEEKDFNPF